MGGGMAKRQNPSHRRMVRDSDPSPVPLGGTSLWMSSRRSSATEPLKTIWNPLKGIVGCLRTALVGKVLVICGDHALRPGPFSTTPRKGEEVQPPAVWKAAGWKKAAGWPHPSILRKKWTLMGSGGWKKAICWLCWPRWRLGGGCVWMT